MARRPRGTGELPRRSFAKESKLSWIILWETRVRADLGRWSVAIEQSEADALKRAERFLKLGFVVHAIKDPSGSVFMDEQQIAERLGKARVP